VSAVEETIVLRFADEQTRKDFLGDLLARFPFDGQSESRIIGMASGDAMSVSDAIQAALQTSTLDSFERHDFAVDMCNAVNWQDCERIAAEWDLRWEQGDFVDVRALQGGVA
jgi:hypothetical protein